MSIKTPLPANIDPNLNQIFTVILFKAIDGSAGSDFFLLNDAGGSGKVCKVEAVYDATYGNWTLQLSSYA